MQKITKVKFRFTTIIIVLTGISLLVSCAGHHLGKNNSGEHKNGMVVSANHLASEVGVEKKKKGGNIGEFY